MADKLSPERRSWNMSRIKGQDTKPEMKVRSYLFRQGFRFRKNDKRYPGKPDIVLPMYKTVVFVHGCFWHRHPGCKDATTPKTRTEFWMEKLSKNVANDRKNVDALKELGFRVIIVWECEIEKEFASTMDRLVSMIKEADSNG